MAPGNGVNTRNVVHEVEFTLHDTAHLFVDVSDAEDCQLELAEMLPRKDGRYGEFFTVWEANPERISEHASRRDAVEVYVHEEREDGGLFEFLISGDCPALTLAKMGALPREVRGCHGQGQIVAEIPKQYDQIRVIEEFLNEYPESELRAKREKERLQPMFVDSALQQAAERHLTDRQRDVLETALKAGYYDWPRESTGKEVAEELEITSSTFSQHIQAAERNLLSLFFDDT